MSVCIFYKSFHSKCHLIRQPSNQRWNTEESTSSTELNAGWDCWQSALLQEVPTGIWQSRRMVGAALHTGMCNSAQVNNTANWRTEKGGVHLTKSKDITRWNQRAISKLKRFVRCSEFGHSHTPGLSQALQARKWGSFKPMSELVRAQLRHSITSILPGTDCPLGTTDSWLPASPSYPWALCNLWPRQQLVRVRRPLQPQQTDESWGRICLLVGISSCFPCGISSRYGNNFFIVRKNNSTASSAAEHWSLRGQCRVSSRLCRKRPLVLQGVVHHWLEINFHLFLSHFCQK